MMNFLVTFGIHKDNYATTVTDYLLLIILQIIIIILTL
jgi:hypothetical protein